MYARLKTPFHRVWQYKDDVAVIDIPMWVNGITEMHGDGLFLLRDSGKQRIDSGDWLVQEDQDTIVWCTDQEFQRDYELLYGQPHPPAAA